MKSVYLNVYAPIRPVPNLKELTSRTGTLSNMSVEKINAVLGFKPNAAHDPDKSTVTWNFKVLGLELSIWDYKGSAKHGVFSAYGSPMIFTELFGEQNYKQIADYEY